MSAVPLIRAKMVVAIADDDFSNATSTQEEIKDAGFDAVIMSGGFVSVQQFVVAVSKTAEAVVCDHRLSPGKFAQFTGAEAVASLVQSKIPSILVTSFRKRDIQTSIRLWRRQIPVLLDKDNIDPDAIAKGLAVCAEEIAGRPLATRIPRQTILRVASNEEHIVDVFVPAWNPDDSVPIPLKLFPEQLQPKVKPGQCFFAKVNIGATNSDELFFTDFVLAPEADPEDHLG